jgi:hypothetical protein
MREEPRVFGGHYGVLEVVRNLGQGDILISPRRVPSCPPGFHATLELDGGEGGREDPQHDQSQETAAVEAQPQTEAQAQHRAEPSAPTHVEPS